MNTKLQGIWRQWGPEAERCQFGIGGGVGWRRAAGEPDELQQRRRPFPFLSIANPSAVPSGDQEATWVKRCPSDDEPGDGDKDKSSLLTDTQKEKLSHFFAHVFDMDRDDIISLQDIEGFTERKH
ncbi:unnamed protein product [Nesidiocoris tenuis]|uniref:EF-hand domain-containing protein n=1 Tax=Nesidiocoris tenuis TaxID=355587 RepID=A0A6H5GZL7_9HEMI|nr:unnamed protein product [Nesidiocoris tenuis]